MAKKIACLGDSSDHGGTIISTGGDSTFLVGGVPVAIHGALHSCPISGHGVTALNPVTVRSFHNLKEILTEGAVAGCGAVITPPDRGITVE